MPYARAYAHRRRSFARRHVHRRYRRHYSRRRGLSRDLTLLLLAAIVLLVIASMSSH